MAWISLHFTVKDKEHSQCNHCKKWLKRSGGTKGLTSHLLTAHNISKRSCDQQTQGSSKNTATQDKTIPDFFAYVSLEETVAKLAAESGLSLRQITKSTYIRKCLKKDFPKRTIPKNQSGMMKLIVNYYEQAKKSTINEITNLKTAGKKFSITLDEWSSKKNVKYLNVNVHVNSEENNQETKYFNLGMIRIQESCPAETLNRLLLNRLDSFGLEIEADICSGTGDGAPVMEKFGSNSCIEYSICLNHTIHLAVMDVVFPKKKNSQCEESSDDDLENAVSDHSDADSSVEKSESDGFDDCSSEDESEKELRETERKFDETVIKMRKIVRTFKFSTVKNAVLRRTMIKDGISPRNLVLDCKTRWNSLGNSISVFLSCLPSILKALKHAKINSKVAWLDIDTHLMKVRFTVRFRLAVEFLIITRIFLSRPLRNF
jgi:BED zinc finger